jgi:predicted  nucleic acid-binding Zn-ribbon protein
VKYKKLMRRIQTLFDEPERQRRQQRKKLQHALKKLRKKQKSLEEKLAQEADSNDRQELSDKIALLKQQRRKLIRALATD